MGQPQPSTSAPRAVGHPGSALSAVILAAGKGTRMKSDLPKVLHPIGGRPMVCEVIDACLEVHADPIVVVVGHRQELVRQALREYGSRISFAVQEPQQGTGHAVQCAKEALGAAAGTGDCLVLCGDGPLIRAQTLRELHARHVQSQGAAALATAVIDDPTGYGRIVRGPQGEFRAIVEHKDASEHERRIREVNPSYYCFRAQDLFEALALVTRHEPSGEYYITDTLPLLLSRGRRVEVLPAVPPEDVLSINTPEDLARVDAIHRARGAGRRG
jgi:bifunctional UDP-N-acetylglucosamine pyrophosphorylase / glucosamine-1-phosphate N-acetyltransferase